jgi:hypothetical protein
VQCHQLLVAGYSSIHTAYVAMRELGLNEMPVIMLAAQQGPGSSSSSSRGSSGSNGDGSRSGSGSCSVAKDPGLQQNPQQQQQWQLQQQASIAEHTYGGKHAVVHRLPREVR